MKNTKKEQIKIENLPGYNDDNVSRYRISSYIGVYRLIKKPYLPQEFNFKIMKWEASADAVEEFHCGLESYECTKEAAYQEILNLIDIRKY